MEENTYEEAQKKIIYTINLCFVPGNDEKIDNAFADLNAYLRQHFNKFSNNQKRFLRNYFVGNLFANIVLTDYYESKIEVVRNIAKYIGFDNTLNIPLAIQMCKKSILDEFAERDTKNPERIRSTVHMIEKIINKNSKKLKDTEKAIIAMQLMELYDLISSYLMSHDVDDDFLESINDVLIKIGKVIGVNLTNPDLYTSIDFPHKRRYNRYFSENQTTESANCMVCHSVATLYREKDTPSRIFCGIKCQQKYYSF